jgi:hypothetical protein
VDGHYALYRRPRKNDIKRPGTMRHWPDLDRNSGRQARPLRSQSLGLARPSFSGLASIGPSARDSAKFLCSFVMSDPTFPRLAPTVFPDVCVGGFLEVKDRPLGRLYITTYSPQLSFVSEDGCTASGSMQRRYQCTPCISGFTDSPLRNETFEIRRISCSQKLIHEAQV